MKLPDGRKNRRRGNPNKYPKNLLYRCDACGGCFRESTQMTKMDLHCKTMGGCNTAMGLHHGWSSGKLHKNLPRFYRVSDSVTDFRKWCEEN